MNDSKFHRRKPPQRWLDNIYRTPDPVETLEEYRRFHHQDVAKMGPIDRQRELLRIEIRLAFDTKPQAWLTERLVALVKGEL